MDTRSSKTFDLASAKLKAWQKTLKRWWDEDTPSQKHTIFYSARLKLSGFYLIVLIIFSLTLTLSLRSLAGHSFDQAGAGYRGVVRRLFNNYFSVPPPQGSKSFNRYQSSQSASVHRELNRDTIIINVIVVVVGAAVSYWYAGRTLKPIEEAHRAQARFASDASHELRTPLASLKLENEIFLKQKKPTLAGAKDVIKSNLEEVQRLEQLASNLLALTQYENEALELSPVSAKLIVVDAVENIKKEAGAKSLKLEVGAVDKKVLGHHDSLVQLVSIILDNAVKYSPAKRTIYIEGHASGEDYVIYVRDEGLGIAEEDLPHIFERLYRGDKSRGGQVAGYGLGLSLAKEIARANEAGIFVRNREKGGAEFAVRLHLAG